MWHLEFTAEQGKATRTFVCTVPVCQHRVTTEQQRIRAEKRATQCWASDRAGSTIDNRIYGNRFGNASHELIRLNRNSPR